MRDIALSSSTVDLAIFQGQWKRFVSEIVDKRSYAIDPSQAIDILGFEPKPLAEGIVEMKSLSL